MDLGQRQVAEDEAQPPVEALAHPPHDRLRGRAVRALEIAVHDEFQRRAGGAGDVIGAVERGREHGRGGDDPRLPRSVSELELLLGLLFGAVLLVRVAEHAGVPYPIVLVLGGVALAFVPGVPRVHMDPHVVLLVFVPPLLLSAGWYSSPRELKAESRALGLLALALVLVTTGVVAVAAHSMVDGFSWPAAFMLGAVIAPTDAVAAAATFTSVHVPERVRLLVQGESLINDATGLTAFRVAVTAALAGTFSFGRALLEFVLAAAAGAAIGLAVGWLILRAIRRRPDVVVSVLLTLLAAYASYVAAETAHTSGILAAAV